MHKIAEDLLPLAFPVDQLNLLPGNPRKGDVDSVVASLEKFGQRKPIVARRIPGEDGGEVLAGNTTLKAARRLEWTEIAVVWTDDDDATAAGFALADNRTHDLGEYLDDELAAMIQRIEDDDELLDASGYDLMDLDDLMSSIAGEEPNFEFEDDDGTLNDEPAEPKRAPSPVIQYAIIFDDEGQQQKWFAFVRWLKSNFEADTLAGRLDEFLDTLDGID